MAAGQGRRGSLGWFSGGVLRGFSFRCHGLAGGDLGLLDTGMVWGGLCSAAVHGCFGVVISAVSDHGWGLWDPFRQVWDPDIALVLRGGCGLDGEIGVGDAFVAWGFVSVQSQVPGRTAWAWAFGPWSVVVGFAGLMIFFTFQMVYLWRAYFCSTSSFVHPFEVLGEYASLIGLSHNY
jgi:hypothetical protein